MNSRPQQFKPQPKDGKCNPLCSLFRCGKRSLVYTTRYYRGKPRKVAFCRWVGDYCKGYECQYAYCEKRALLPDGKCSFAIKGPRKKDMLEEIAELSLEEHVKTLITRKIGKKDLYFIE
ncbi:MAG TPA: hypothetical protein EYH40_02015 [Desulfurococcales archaeon]|nr:hypothetical protein [Desulfurococcales archaeon]